MNEMAKPCRLHDVFCERIAELRREQGLTQTEVADRLGVHQATYAQIESGRRIPRLDLVERVAAAFNVEAADLMQPRVEA